MPANYNTKMTDKEYKHMSVMKKLSGEDDNEIIIENAVLCDSIEEQCNGDIENNGCLDTSEDDDEELTDMNCNKYGPNSPLLNIDHGANPQFINNDE